MKKLTPTTEAGPAPTEREAFEKFFPAAANNWWPRSNQYGGSYYDLWNGWQARGESDERAKGATPEIQAPTENASVIEMVESLRWAPPVEDSTQEDYRRLRDRVAAVSDHILHALGAKGAEIQVAPVLLLQKAADVCRGAMLMAGTEEEIGLLARCVEEIEAIAGQVAPVLSDERKQGLDHPAEASNEGKAP